MNADSDGQNSAGKMIESENGNGSKFTVRLASESAGNVEIIFQLAFSTTVGVWSTPVDVSLNAYHACQVDYDSDDVANNPSIFVDDTSETITEDTTPVGTRVSNVAEAMMIGARKSTGSGKRTFDGDLFMVSLWSVILSANEREALAKGVNPFVIRNESLVFHVPMWGNESPEVEYTIPSTGNIVGAVKSNNPPVELLENNI